MEGIIAGLELVSPLRLGGLECRGLKVQQPRDPGGVRLDLGVDRGDELAGRAIDCRDERLAGRGYSLLHRDDDGRRGRRRRRQYRGDRRKNRVLQAQEGTILEARLK